MLMDINMPRVKSNRAWREWHYKAGYIEDGWTFFCPNKGTFLTRYRSLLNFIDARAMMPMGHSILPEDAVMSYNVWLGYEATLRNPWIKKI